jgi:uncharacterized membrane protein YcaP (DUF421 family)
MDIALRSVFLFFFVYLLMRALGRRELSSLEPFDLILLVVLGDAIQQGLTQDDYSVTGAMIVISTIGTLAVLTSYANFRLPWVRRVLDGQPIVLIQDGKVIEHNLKRERITADEIAEEARSQQISSLEDVQWAVFEPSGKISFIMKSR